MSRIVYWKEGDSKYQLWVCESCGAELDADCVGPNACPVCGVAHPDNETEEDEQK